MNVEFELERARKRVAWLEAVEALEIGNVYEYEDDGRLVIFVLTNVDLGNDASGQITGMTLYDKYDSKQLSPHTVHFSMAVVDCDFKFLTQYEATERIDELNATVGCN